MTHYNEDNNKSNPIIDDVEVTGDVLSSRAGLSLFVRYLRSIVLFPYLEDLFSKIRKSRKGQEISEIFKQLFCFFMDGTSRHLVYFDTLKEDEGYAGSIETDPENMLSSHAVKRFFGAIWLPWSFLFRTVLQKLFLWRLYIEKPLVIVLGLDTMVMDNNEAEKREGVKPTYKKEKGFQPLQMAWGRFIIDAVFRSGDKHSNHSDDVEKMVRRIVKLIRKHYREDVPIVIRMDSGFFDQKLFEVFESLRVGYICGGKLYDDITAYVGSADKSFWGCYENKNQVWNYVEFGDRRGNWKRFRRAIFCRPKYEDKQMLLKFARPDTLIYTNLGMGETIDEGLRKAGMEKMLTPQGIIETHHGRGCDELVHRALKDFSSEQLPFKRFYQNAAFYYTMLIAFFLYEAFKEDVCAPVIRISSYATTLRRRILDIAGKIVNHSGKVTLKITISIWENLNFYQLWLNSENPIQIYRT
ncbi:MAG: IS1380 family transposase [Deltaproteobacteria bacterium]|nr:IS1380 family transposase [Deltaproteobacteria bacterium]